jgi:hypothetical protein
MKWRRMRKRRRRRGNLWRTNSSLINNMADRPDVLLQVQVDLEALGCYGYIVQCMDIRFALKKS